MALLRRSCCSSLAWEFLSYVAPHWNYGIKHLNRRDLWIIFVGRVYPRVSWKNCVFNYLVLSVGISIGNTKRGDELIFISIIILCQLRFLSQVKPKNKKRKEKKIIFKYIYIYMKIVRTPILFYKKLGSNLYNNISNFFKAPTLNEDSNPQPQIQAPTWLQWGHQSF